MNSDVGSSSTRPQIQVVRLPSNERAKITLDGVQLRAQYHHFRSGDYVRACAVSNGALDRCAVTESAPHSRSEELLLRTQDSDPTYCYHFCLAPRKRHKQRDLITNSVETLLNNSIKSKKQNVLNLSTKSCDNIFEKYFVRGKEKMGFTWKDTTRSEEQLSCIGQKQSRNSNLPKSRGFSETATNNSGLASRLLGRLLRHLQPRLDAKRSSERSTLSSVGSVPTDVAPESIGASSSPPWIVVSFSRRDLEGSPPPEVTVAARNTEVEVTASVASMTTKHRDSGGERRIRQQQWRGHQPPHRPQTQFAHSLHHHGAHDMYLDKAPPATPQRYALHHATGTRVVPTAHASSRHHYYRSRRGGGGRLLLNQHAASGVATGLAGSGRPHTLYLAPSSSSSASPTTAMERRGGAVTLRKLASSFESIGSCSLDVDITASESSGLLEARGGCGTSLSQRTLHSLDSQRLVTHSTEELSTNSSSRHFVKRAAKLFDSADISNSDDSVFTPPRTRPSYVSLSCSVSGYTRATNYSSSRLRDPSPCARQSGGGSPTPLLLARTSPAHRITRPSPSAAMNGHHTDTVNCAAAVMLNGQSSTSSGNNVTQYSKQSYISHMGPSSIYNETSSWHTKIKQPESSMSNGAAANTSKSFIQQRVERLYGRGALAQGFFRNIKATTNGDMGSHTFELKSREDQKSEYGSSNFPELPVLRHLRPEFREQLSIGPPKTIPWWKQRQSPPRACNGASPITSPREHIIPITIESDHNANQKEIVQNDAVNDTTKEKTCSDMVSSVVSVCDVAIQAQEVPCDLQPAAPEVVPAVIAVNTQPESDNLKKDGHHFLELLNKETQRLLAMAAETEIELESKPDLHEEASGKLRTAIGQARLLVRQKLQQFEGLCHRNLTQGADEPFPTTSDDLAGFWDMVQLQVAHVDSLFKELNDMREQGWQEVSPKHAVKNGKPKARRSTTGVSNTHKVTPKLSEKAQEAARLRDEQRKKMMEERRRSAKLNQKKTEENSVEIFAPDTSL